jgi:DNA-binding PadR family transcriptional regulator
MIFNKKKVPEEAKPKTYIHPNSVVAYKAARKGAAKSQVEVLKALYEMRTPAHYRMLSQYMNAIEGCVTPRLAELRRKGFVEIAYVNHGFNRVKVNFYRITYQGKQHLEEVVG